MKISRRLRLACVLVVLVLFAGGTLFAAGAQEKEEEKKVLRVAWNSEPLSLDPHYDTSGSIMPIQRLVHEPLIKLSKNLEYIPWLATDWEKVDELTWRITLREGVEYHSGNPFNAAAVKAFFDRTFDPDNQGRQREWIPEIVDAKVVEEYVVDIITGKPHATFLDDLSRIHIHITDAVRANEIGEEHGIRPSGTGPFELEEWRTGESLRFVANENYWGGRPALDEVIIEIIPEAASAVMALESGDIDLLWNISPHEASRLGGMDKINIHTASTARPMVYHFNLHPDHPVLNDKRVREAITFAIDKEVIADEILGDMAEPLRGFLGEDVFGFAEFDQPYDPAEAAALMRQAGWSKRGGVWTKGSQKMTLELMHAEFWPRQAEVAEQVQAQLSEFGADVSIRTIDRGIYWDIAGKAANLEMNELLPYDMFFLGNGQRTRDGGPNLQDTYSSWGVSQVCMFRNDDFDAALRKGLAPGPVEERLKAYEEAQRILFEEVVVAQMYTVNLIQASRSYVSGFEAHPMEEPFWERIDIRK